MKIPFWISWEFIKALTNQCLQGGGLTLFSRQKKSEFFSIIITNNKIYFTPNIKKVSVLLCGAKIKHNANILLKVKLFNEMLSNIYYRWILLPQINPQVWKKNHCYKNQKLQKSLFCGVAKVYAEIRFCANISLKIIGRKLAKLFSLNIECSDRCR